MGQPFIIRDPSEYFTDQISIVICGLSVLWSSSSLILPWRFFAATGSIWDARKADVISTGDVFGAKAGALVP